MSTSAKALLLALITAALVAASYRWGVTATTNAYEAGQLKDERAKTAELKAEVKRGEVASGGLQMDLRDLGTDYSHLERAFNDLRKRPLLARPAGPLRGAAAHAGARAGASGAPGAPDAAGDAPGCVVLPVVLGGDPALSFGAVWMWNSALQGRDATSGSCGLADQSEEACAADSGISLDDAWGNQALNAKLCAEDRLKHQHLIDFIKGRPR